MDLTNKQIERLIEAVEDEGGEHLDEMCTAREYELTGDRGKRPGEYKTLMLPGCGTYLMFEFPYMVPLDKTKNASTISPIKLCGICDRMFDMPRFSGAAR